MESKKDAKKNLKNIGDTFGRGDLEEDLRQARHPNHAVMGRNNNGLITTQDQGAARRQSESLPYNRDNEVSPYDMPSAIQG